MLSFVVGEPHRDVRFRQSQALAAKQFSISMRAQKASVGRLYPYSQNLLLCTLPNVTVKLWNILPMIIMDATVFAIQR